jgi:hypothetical protein
MQHQERSFVPLENGKFWVPKVDCYYQGSVNGSLVKMEVAKASAAAT